MENIHIVLDSTAAVAPDMLWQYDHLHQVSLKLRLGGEEWNEDELPATLLFEKVNDSGYFPQTSQPPLGDFVDIFQRIMLLRGKVIVLTVSSGLSGTFQGAKAAARMVDEDNICVLDTKTAAAGIVNITKKALDLIAAGASYEDIIERLRQVIESTHTLLLPDSLDYLHRGGRIGGAAVLFGNLFKIKPILFLEDGRVAVLDKVRTRVRAISRMIAEVQKYKELEYIGVVHSGAEADASQAAEQLQAFYPSCEISVNEVNSVLAAHVGPAAMAFMYQEKVR